MELAKTLLDLNMMAANPSGARERTQKEYSQLFQMAGLELQQLYFTRSLNDIMETKKLN